MIYDWEKRFEYIDMMNVHIQHIWNAVPFARPESMKSIKNYHDIWDWCDGSNIDFDIFEKSVTMHALEKVSKISVFEIKIDNGYYNLISSKEHISFSGSNLLILLSEFIKTFKIIEDTDTMPMEKNIISVHERSFKLS